MLLAEPKWARVLTDDDKRGVNPLFTSNMTPYGEVKVTWPAGWTSPTPRHRSQTSTPSQPERAIRGRVLCPS